MLVFVAALCVGTGLIAVAYGLSERFKLRSDSLERLLSAELAEPSNTPDALADLVERAGHVADRALGGTSMIHKVQVMLGQAGWSLRPGEFAAALAGGTIVLGVLFWLAGSPGLAIVAVIVTPLFVVSWVDRKGRSRARRVEEQLPTVLQLLAGSLEAGSSVLHSLELAAEEGEDPIATELGRVVAETRVGRPLAESLDALAARIGSRDLDWTVEAIRIQHATGGRLADTLRVLADFMRARVEVRGEVRALTAEARLSAKVLTALPFLVGGWFFLFRPTYLEPLLNSSAGHSLLAVAAAGLVLGTVWMRRIVKLEV